MNLLKLSLVLFGGGSTYVPPVDTSAEDAAAEAAAEAAAKKEKLLAGKRKGRKSTILTSGLGLSGTPTTSAATPSGKKTLGE